MNNYSLAAWEIASRSPDTHPFQVAIEVAGLTSDTSAFLLALLHDSVEDEYATEQEILDRFPNDMYHDVMSLTRAESESYSAYLERLLQGSERARIVKVADATVNLRRCLDSENLSLASRYEDVLERLGRVS